MTSDPLPSDRPPDAVARDDSPPDLPYQPSPPLAPEQASPWWSAPAGKPVDIPAFGRDLFA